MRHFENNVIELSEEESIKCVRNLATKVERYSGKTISDYLLKNYKASINCWSGTIRNLSSLVLEDVYILNTDSVILNNCLITSSIIEAHSKESMFLPSLGRNNFEHCIFINIDLTDTRWFDCTFKQCLFLHCTINSYFCNNNQIKEEIYFNEVTYDENKRILTEYYPMVCPAEGSFIAWKKVRTVATSDVGPFPYLVKLLIPEDAQRTSSFSHKCRASKAVVLDIINPKTMKPERVDVCSIADSHFEYRVGETVEPTKYFEPDRFVECGPGIHFFLNKYEALHY
jgi:hypothetical protein